MTEDDAPPLRVNAYIRRLAPLLYGQLHLLPDQVNALTFIDIDDMKRGLEAEEMRKRWEIAHWVALMIQPHVKEEISAEMLMKPFLPEKTEQEMLAEKEHLKQVFNLG